MKGKIGISSQPMRVGVPNLYPHRWSSWRRERVVVRWWFEWIENGKRQRSPPGSDVCRQGALAATHGLTMGREKFGLRHGAEVVIPVSADRARAFKALCRLVRQNGGEVQGARGVRVSRLYIDGRPVEGAELKSLLAKVQSAQERRRDQTTARLKRLDADLAAIG